MIEVLAIVVICGDCNVCRQAVRQKIVAPVVTHQVAAVQVPILDPYYAYTVGTADRLRKLEEIVERQQQLVEQQAHIIEQFRAAPASGAAGGESALTAAARDLLHTNCLACHSGPDAKGQLNLAGAIDLPTKLLVAEVVHSGAMPPPPKSPLSDADAATIRAWAHEDTSAVRAFLRQASARERRPPNKPE